MQGSRMQAQAAAQEFVSTLETLLSTPDSQAAQLREDLRRLVELESDRPTT